ncbi:glycogen synthase GlgA [Geobacter sp. DSM 9736]|uniref:glycogen synthase GlgA n=1 Tax=Geobacter sp. DSM 9736 TaxID=1277350 RepID=UPI000B500669|nr:glycogen synthase GlgA [Geobacter sp. DSM 9736]SNB47712.1 glycogen synthase (ADP-glucose) [Geobacter sp. DSM 9736]
MKIVMIASEVTPFAKTGGLADVVGSLPKELKRLGHDVRIFIPFYREVEKGGFSIRKGRKSVEVPADKTMQKGLLRQTALDDIPVYLIEHKGYFGRDTLYGGPTGDYPDNAQRFSFFCRGVLDVLKKLDFRPDVLHCHDWQTALIPILLRYEMEKDPFFGKTATLFTIHNLAYQGIFPAEALPAMGLSAEYLTMDRLEYYGNLNLMKGGILTADVVTTVSPTYCEEICGPEQGFGLDGVLRTREDRLFGVLNGLDYSIWDPAHDRNLAKNYTPTAISGRTANKLALQKQLGLEQKVETPLVAMVTRLVSQKGIDLVVELLPQLAEQNLQLVILGNGDRRYVDAIESFRQTHPGKIALSTGFNGSLAHRIYAGSDIFMMPSQFEPCGLGQLIALRYGSVPLVHSTGGLKDTVTDQRDSARDHLGFTFTDYSSAGLWEAMERALQIFGENRQEWKKLMRRGMNADYSWAKSAVKYEELYRLALKRRER